MSTTGTAAAAAAAASPELQPLLPRRLEEGRQGKLEDKQVYSSRGRYSARYATSICCFFEFHSTAFAALQIWIHVFGYLLFSAIVCVILFFSCRRPELINTTRMSELVVYSSAIVGFVLIFHLSFSLKRWWTLRIETLGGFWSASADLMMVTSAHFPDASATDLKALVKRYCLASLELTFLQAQGTDGVLRRLMEVKLLSDDERRKLEELVSKPQAMWVWLAGIFQRLTAQGKLSSRMCGVFYDISARGRATVGRGRGAFAYVDTQIPFAYVHFLAVLVHLNSLAIAGKCGVVAAVAIWNLRRSESAGPVSDMENAQVLVIQVVMVLCLPTFYHAILEEVAQLSDPLKDGPKAFQRATCTDLLQRECEALQAAGERPPIEAFQVTEEFEIREGDIAHDFAVIKGAQQSLLS